MVRLPLSGSEIEGVSDAVGQNKLLFVESMFKAFIVHFFYAVENVSIFSHLKSVSGVAA